MNVDPGDLNKKIKIILKSGKDSDGYPTNDEKVIKECYAGFNRTSGTEAVKSNADFGDIKARFLIRYTSTPITRKMVVRYNQTDYNIVYVNDYGDSHEYIEIWTDLAGLN